MKSTVKNHPFGNTPLINWIFDDVLTKNAYNTGTSVQSALNAFNTPKLNVLDSENDIILELAIPGLEKKDFNLDIKNGILHVTATKEAEKNSDLKFKSREFNYNNFKRSYKIPEHTDVKNIGAEYINGILKISLPKMEAAKSGHSIKVK